MLVGHFHSCTLITNGSNLKLWKLRIISSDWIIMNLRNSVMASIFESELDSFSAFLFIFLMWFFFSLILFSTTDHEVQLYYLSRGLNPFTFVEMGIHLPAKDLLILCFSVPKIWCLNLKPGSKFLSPRLDRPSASAF